MRDNPFIRLTQGTPALSLPQKLYHGSAYEQEELMPGFKHSKVPVYWDKYESNTYLYTTTHRDSAILLGFSSAVEKHYDLSYTHLDEQSRRIVLEFSGNTPPTLKELLQIDVFLYTISVREGVWLKCNNPFNNIDSEWKTKSTIPAGDIISREKIDLPKILENYQITIR